MIYLLDSNVLSEMWKPQPDSAVVNWFFSAEWFLPSPVIAEIQEGAATGTESKVRKHHQDFQPGSDGLGCGNRPDVRPVETFSGGETPPQQLWDILLDAMAVRYGATIATRNAADFRHAKTFNPWKSKYPPGEPPA
jgi:predicted nucleic acid-binding protein